MTAVDLPRWPRLGLGCARIGSFGNPASAAQSLALLRGAFDLGLRLFDTADIYGQGDSERLVGKALAGRRDGGVIVTKGGRLFSAKMRLLRPLKPLLRPFLALGGLSGAVTAQRAGEERMNWTPAHLVAALERSLRRLRTDRVDAFLLHSPPAEVLRQPETADVLARMVASGKALRAGAACDDLEQLEAALAMPYLDVLELPWSVLCAIAGTPQAAALDKRGITVIAREVIVQQPDVPAGVAVAKAMALPFVTTTLVGSGRIDRLRAIADQVGAGTRGGAGQERHRPGPGIPPVDRSARAGARHE